LQLLNFQFCDSQSHDHFRAEITAPYPKRKKREEATIGPFDVSVSTKFTGYPIIRLAIKDSWGLKTFCAVVSDRMIKSASKKYVPNFSQQPSLSFNQREDGKVVLTLPPLTQLVIQQGYEWFQALGFDETLFEVLPKNEGYRIQNKTADLMQNFDSSSFSQSENVLLKKIYSDWVNGNDDQIKKPSPEAFKISFMPLFNPFVYETTFPIEMKESSQSINLIKRYFRLLMAYVKEIWNFAKGSLTPKFRKVHETDQDITWNIQMNIPEKKSGVHELSSKISFRRSLFQNTRTI
jgi:hypothetical protein